jgi:hypothetical protein
MTKREVLIYGIVICIAAITTGFFITSFIELLKVAKWIN